LDLQKDDWGLSQIFLDALHPECRLHHAGVVVIYAE